MRFDTEVDPNVIAAGTGPTYADVIIGALERSPDRVAFVQGDRRMTYAEAADLTGRLAQVLVGAGVRRGAPSRR